MQKDKVQFYDVLSPVQTFGARISGGRKEAQRGECTRGQPRTFGRSSSAMLRTGQRTSGGLPPATLTTRHPHHPCEPASPKEDEARGREPLGCWAPLKGSFFPMAGVVTDPARVGQQWSSKRASVSGETAVGPQALSTGGPSRDGERSGVRARTELKRQAAAFSSRTTSCVFQTCTYVYVRRELNVYV